MGVGTMEQEVGAGEQALEEWCEYTHLSEGRGLAWGRGLSPPQMTRVFSPWAPQDTLCFLLELLSQPLQNVCAKGNTEESGERGGAGAGWGKLKGL